MRLGKSLGENSVSPSSLRSAFTIFACAVRKRISPCRNSIYPNIRSRSKIRKKTRIFSTLREKNTSVLPPRNGSGRTSCATFVRRKAIRSPAWRSRSVSRVPWGWCAEPTSSSMTAIPARTSSSSARLLRYPSPRKRWTR